jgi:hypothetical protein
LITFLCLTLTAHNKAVTISDADKGFEAEVFSSQSYEPIDYIHYRRRNEREKIQHFFIPWSFTSSKSQSACDSCEDAGEILPE